MKVSDLSYRRRRAVVALWLLALLVTVTLAGAFTADDETTYETPGDRSREHGAFANAGGRPSRINAA